MQAVQPLYVLGGHQTDFARNWARKGVELFDALRETVEGALADARVDPDAVESAHVGNFTAELFCRQATWEACSPRCTRPSPGFPAGGTRGPARPGASPCWAPRRSSRRGATASHWWSESSRCATCPAPRRPSTSAHRPCGAVTSARLGDEYDARYGLRHDHLAQIARTNFANARRNPAAQTRGWHFDAESFAADDERNPVIDGRIRKQDCGQITDGAAAVVLASAERAAEYARARGLALSDLPRLRGWGHRTAPIAFEAKLRESRDAAYVFPHVRGTVTDAFRRAGVADVWELDALEVHDCFTTTEYMAIGHFGLTPPGASWKAIESGEIAFGGRLPVNPSGGLIGAGHPVGATGVRMLLDASRQVAGAAGECQVEGARNVATLNIGGSATTTVSFVVGRG